jgi:hypothetical protein
VNHLYLFPDTPQKGVKIAKNKSRWEGQTIMNKKIQGILFTQGLWVTVGAIYCAKLIAHFPQMGTMVRSGSGKRKPLPFLSLYFAPLYNQMQNEGCERFCIE